MFFRLTDCLFKSTVRAMTTLLEKAIESISLESTEVQNWIASLIMEEILEEKAWEKAFFQNS